MTLLRWDHGCPLLLNVMLSFPAKLILILRCPGHFVDRSSYPTPRGPAPACHARKASMLYSLLKFVQSCVKRVCLPIPLIRSPTLLYRRHIAQNTQSGSRARNCCPRRQHLLVVQSGLRVRHLFADHRRRVASLEVLRRSQKLVPSCSRARWVARQDSPQELPALRSRHALSGGAELGCSEEVDLVFGFPRVGATSPTLYIATMIRE